MGRHKHILEEECRHMQEHKWIESEKAGYNLGETAYFGWVQDYAKDFRSWTDTIPYHCIGCGKCLGKTDRDECPYPFDQERLKHLSRKKTCRA